MKNVKQRAFVALCSTSRENQKITKQKQEEQWFYSRSVGKTMDIKVHLNPENIRISYFHLLQAENGIN